MGATTTVASERALNPDAVILPKSNDWVFEGSELTSFVPGTWVPREPWMHSKILAAFGCPNCKEVRLLAHGIHTIDTIGLVQPDLQCKGQDGRCSYHRKTYLDRWNRKPLYAAAVECWDDTRKKWEAEMVYTHAANSDEARFMLGPMVNGKSYRIVGVGLAIGFFVDGKDDRHLSAD